MVPFFHSGLFHRDLSNVKAYSWYMLSWPGPKCSAFFKQMYVSKSFFLSHHDVWGVRYDHRVPWVKTGCCLWWSSCACSCLTWRNFWLWSDAKSKLNKSMMVPTQMQNAFQACNRYPGDSVLSPAVVEQYDLYLLLDWLILASRVQIGSVQ